MSDETMRPADGDELPVVNEVPAAALAAQGEPGLRMLVFLQDGRLILTGGFLRRLAEGAESCLRGASDALLSLPGAPQVVGLKGVAAARKGVDPLRRQAGLSREAVIERMTESFRGRYGLSGGKGTDEEPARAQDLVRTKFSSPEWTARVP